MEYIGEDFARAHDKAVRHLNDIVEHVIGEHARYFDLDGLSGEYIDATLRTNDFGYWEFYDLDADELNELMMRHDLTLNGAE